MLDTLSEIRLKPYIKLLLKESMSSSISVTTEVLLNREMLMTFVENQVLEFLYLVCYRYETSD